MCSFGEVVASADCARDEFLLRSVASCGLSFSMAFACPFSLPSAPFVFRSLLSAASPLTLAALLAEWLRADSDLAFRAGLDDSRSSLGSSLTSRFLIFVLAGSSSLRMSVSASESPWPLAGFDEFWCPFSVRDELARFRARSGEGDCDFDTEEWRSDGLRTGWWWCR